MTSLMAYERSYEARLKRCEKIVDHIIASLQHNMEPGEIFAQTGFPCFWYKVFVFSPYGVLKFDTCGETPETIRFAKGLIRRQCLTCVTLSDWMKNWHTYGIWEAFRPYGTKILRAWENHTKKEYTSSYDSNT